MKYAIIKNNTITQYGTASELWPSTSFPGGQQNAAFLLEAQAQAIVSDLPHDATTQRLLTVAPYLLDGAVYDVQVVELTPEEIAAALATKRAAMSVTMRQARLALLQAGLLQQVAPAIAAMPDPERSQAEIDWEYATTVDRMSPFVESLGDALGMTETDLDNIFALAATL